jgi:hypothetical protein
VPGLASWILNGMSRQRRGPGAETVLTVKLDSILINGRLIPAADRAVPAAVIMALIAGTTAQPSVPALIIGKHRLPGRTGG